MVRARLEPDLKEQAEAIFKRLGINATQAITMFYKQVEMREGLPFEVVVPNAETLKSIEATEAGEELVACEDLDEMFEKLEV